MEEEREERGRARTVQFPSLLLKSSVAEPAPAAAAGRCRGPSSCAPRALPPAAPALREDECALLLSGLLPPPASALVRRRPPAPASGAGVDSLARCWPALAPCRPCEEARCCCCWLPVEAWLERKLTSAKHTKTIPIHVLQPPLLPSPSSPEPASPPTPASSRENMCMSFSTGVRCRETLGTSSPAVFNPLISGRVWWQACADAATPKWLHASSCTRCDMMHVG